MYGGKLGMRVIMRTEVKEYEGWARGEKLSNQPWENMAKEINHVGYCVKRSSKIWETDKQSRRRLDEPPKRQQHSHCSTIHREGFVWGLSMFWQFPSRTLFSLMSPRQLLLYKATAMALADFSTLLPSDLKADRLRRVFIFTLHRTSFASTWTTAGALVHRNGITR